ncbi:MAG: photosystem II protein PsbQ, partial [Prochlorococcaceae cyanobacterium]
MACSLVSNLRSALRRLMLLALAAVLSFGLAACDGNGNRKQSSISPEDMALISRQAAGFQAAKDRLPELASLVNGQDWTFTRNLIHGPMHEVGRE